MAEVAWSGPGMARTPDAAKRRRRPPPRLRTSVIPHRDAPKWHRTIFISDIHLGTRSCKADMLAQFLAKNVCETLYLVGDIVDGWQLKRGWYWSPAQTEVLREILRKVDAGTRVIYVPGNHDEFLRAYCDRVVAGIEIVSETIHRTADGRRFLVTHGDQFDRFVACARWHTWLGDLLYFVALTLNDCLGAARQRLGKPYWSLSMHLKTKIRDAVRYIARFENAVGCAAADRGVDGVVCGHIHAARMREIGGVLYLNDGDWVESCTALVEDSRGRFEILFWQGARTTSRAPALAAAVPATITA